MLMSETSVQRSRRAQMEVLLKLLPVLEGEADIAPVAVVALSGVPA